MAFNLKCAGAVLMKGQRLVVQLRRKVKGRRGKIGGVLLAGMVGIAVAGCASMGGGLSKDAPAGVKEAAVGGRAKARWDALLRQDYEAAYDFFSPASRQTVSLAKFRGQKRVVRYRAANVDTVVCEREVCKVSISLTYDHAAMKGVVTPLKETWLIEDGQAWLVYGS